MGVSAYELRQHASRYLDRVAKGETLESDRSRAAGGATRADHGGRVGRHDREWAGVPRARRCGRRRRTPGDYGHRRVGRAGGDARHRAVKLYLDSSALVKLVVPRARVGRAAPVLARTSRRTRRSRARSHASRSCAPCSVVARRPSRTRVDSSPVVDQINLDHRLLDDAATIAPGAALRSLDAFTCRRRAPWVRPACGGHVRPAHGRGGRRARASRRHTDLSVVVSPHPVRSRSAVAVPVRQLRSKFGRWRNRGRSAPGSWVEPQTLHVARPLLIPTRTTGTLCKEPPRDSEHRTRSTHA